MLTETETVGLPKEVLVNLPAWGVILLLIFDRVKPLLWRQREQQAELLKAIETVRSAFVQEVGLLERMNRRLARLARFSRTRRGTDRPEDSGEREEES